VTNNFIPRSQPHSVRAAPDVDSGQSPHHEGLAGSEPPSKLPFA
jgi:hypothetical protein